MKKSHSNDTQSFLSLVQKAMKEAFRELVLERRKTGGSLVFCRKNKVVRVPASKVRLPR